LNLSVFENWNNFVIDDMQSVGISETIAAGCIMDIHIYIIPFHATPLHLIQFLSVKITCVWKTTNVEMKIIFSYKSVGCLGTHIQMQPRLKSMKLSQVKKNVKI
jgi:hypothetical protein